MTRFGLLSLFLFVPALHTCGADAPWEQQRVAPSLDALDTTLPIMRAVIERYSQDAESLERFEGRTVAPATLRRSEKLAKDWTRLLESIDFEQLDQDGRIDYLLMRNHLARKLRELKFRSDRNAETDPLVPFAPAVFELHDHRMAKQPVNSREAATKLAEITEQIKLAREAIEQKEIEAHEALGRRAMRRIGMLADTLQSWHQFYDGYDPVFSWWTKQPYATAKSDLDAYRKLVEKTFVGTDQDKDKIVGDPIGRKALQAALRDEWISYTPDELIAIANQEFAWCEAEYRKAAEELGFGDDWRKALAHVKTLHVEPGEQPELIVKLANEAVDFLDERKLVTIPALCRHSWRMQMMSAERQKVNPYFTGGEVITIAFPTDSMAHRDKLMSLLGNNVHFARATVHHELIPGHHLQIFMADRFRPHRKLFRTPFLVEGWALYWEMLLWDMDFHQSAADRIGMLFWRSHRCARIIFSLGFHVGDMTADEAVEFLMERVGHERRNAEAEVRRSVQGAYEPLYQAAYMLGGLQIRQMRRELVDAGKMTDREFHDAILRENSIPVELIRASLTDQSLKRDQQPSWRFYDAE